MRARRQPAALAHVRAGNRVARRARDTTAELGHCHESESAAAAACARARTVSRAGRRGSRRDTVGQTRFTAAVERWRPISRDATLTVQHVTGVKLEEDVLLALVAVESEGKPTERSAAGAVGLAQVMPSTFEDLRTRYGEVLPAASLEEPRFNMLAGALYLADCARALEADLADPDQLALVLHAYNMGLRAAAEWRDSRVRVLETEHGTRSSGGLPPETIEHASRIMAAMQSGDV
jgi:soluble lytic murein transglycosylase-like protein